MKMMFAVGRVTRGATRVLVTTRAAWTAAAAATDAGDGADSAPRPAKRPEPGDFRAAQASPDTVH